MIVMRWVFFFLVYFGIGCAYQSSYADLTVGQIVVADFPISVLGHVLAWPWLIVWHALGTILWIFLALVLLGCAVALWLFWGEAVAALHGWAVKRKAPAGK